MVYHKYQYFRTLKQTALTGFGTLSGLKLSTSKYCQARPARFWKPCRSKKHYTKTLASQPFKGLEPLKG